MQISPYISFKGNCDEAFKFYHEILGGELRDRMTHGNSPMAEHSPKDWHDKILHISLFVGDNIIMGSDAPPQYQEDHKGISISIAPESIHDGERIFNALSEGGTVRMPFQETFWAGGFGMVVDRFGVPWMVNCAK